MASSGILDFLLVDEEDEDVDDDGVGNDCREILSVTLVSGLGKIPNDEINP